MSRTTILLCGPPLSALGGGPTHIRNMLASPLKDRYKIVHFETGSRGAESPATDESVFAKVFRLMTSPYGLASQILRSRPIVVHLNSALNHKAFWRDALYVLISKLLSRKVVFQLHGGSLNVLCARKWVRRMVRRIFAMTDAVVLLATSEKDDFQRLNIQGRLVIIRNAVDVSQYRGARERVHSGKVQRLAYMGRLIRNKGIFEAIQAIEILRAQPRFSDIELRIAGTGSAYEDIDDYIRSHALGSSVKLLGPLFGSRKVEFLREADVFLFPSYHTEGLPYSILESLAAGTPVVAAKTAGIPDVVVDGKHGILIKPRDPEEIVRAVLKLAQSQDVLRAMSRDCEQWASQQLGLERLARQFEALYEELERNHR